MKAASMAFRLYVAKLAGDRRLQACIRAAIERNRHAFKHAKKNHGGLGRNPGFVVSQIVEGSGERLGGGDLAGADQGERVPDGPAACAEAILKIVDAGAVHGLSLRDMEIFRCAAKYLRKSGGAARS